MTLDHAPTTSNTAMICTQATTMTPFKPEHDATESEKRVDALAKLSLLQYEQVRDAEAKALGVRVSVLDKSVAAKRPRQTDEETDSPFGDVELWPEPVDGAKLLEELKATVERFCVLPTYSGPLMAAWALHAWAHESADISPILAIVSPEKRCGKTTALSVISALVPKPMHSVNISTAMIYRVIEKFKPTLLIDEADTYLTDNDELRGVLNGGHNRMSAYVWRIEGDNHEPKPFKVWAPKGIAMIGKLPDTLEDRAIVVHLRRRQSHEVVERFRADRIHDFLPLRRMAARWAADNAMNLSNADPEVPNELNDRAQDNARHICAIADIAGDHWPETIRAALVASAAKVEDEPQSDGVMLLRDIAAIFTTRRGERIGSSDLCATLCALEGSPWGEWRGGKPISPRGIAQMLKSYGISPEHDRAGSFYRMHDFEDAFSRYLAIKT